MKKYTKIIVLSIFILALCGSCRRSRRPSSRSFRTETSTSSTTGYSLSDSSHNTEYASKINEIASSSDYDAMLNVLSQGISDVKCLNNKYLEGNMPQAEFEKHMNSIQQIYTPVINALEKAQNDGCLTYNQQKKMMRLVGDFLKVMDNTLNRVSNDIINSINY